MNKRKIAFWLCLVVLLASQVFWFAVVFDSGITQGYQQATIDEQKQTIAALGELLVRGSAQHTQADILYLLRQTAPVALISEQGDTIFFESMRFVFKEDRLVAVRKE